MPAPSGRYAGAPYSSTGYAGAPVVTPASDPIQSFRVDPNMTPEQAKRQRAMGEALMQQGASVEPVQHWTQALARLAQGGIGGWEANQAGEAEKAGRGDFQQRLIKAMEGGIDPQEAVSLGSDPWAGEGAQGYLWKSLEAKEPSWKTIVDPVTGDVLRYNENDPNPKPELFYDAPTDPQKAATLQKTQLDIDKAKREGPEIKSIFDEQGREVKVQWDPAINDWKQVGGAKLSEGWSITTNPQTGEVTVTQGGKGAGKTTESEGKKMAFGSRMEGAAPNIDKFEGALTSFTEQGKAKLPGGNALVSAEYQQGQQAGRDFLTALLRGDSGGAITAEEEITYGRIYLPQPGDGKEVLAQKKAARARVIRAAKLGLNPAQIQQMEQDTPPPAADGGGGGGGAPQPDATIEVN